MHEVNIQTDITPVFRSFIPWRDVNKTEISYLFTFQRPPYSNEDQVGACQILFNLIKTINKLINQSINQLINQSKLVAHGGFLQDRADHIAVNLAILTEDQVAFTKSFRKVRMESKWVAPAENFQVQRNIWKGIPVVPSGNSCTSGVTLVKHYLWY